VGDENEKEEQQMKTWGRMEGNVGERMRVQEGRRK